MFHSKAFKDFVYSVSGIRENEAEQILSSFKPVLLKYKDHFLREGEICSQIGYVNAGCLSYYQLFENGKKSIVQFAFEDWWVGDLESFIHRKPTAYFWQALEPVELICIGRDDFEKWMNTSESFRTVFNNKTQKAYIKSLEHAAKDKAENAEEKYLRMLAEYPQIIQRIPHYDVAAYLGITPESLSRIRNKLARKK